MVIDKNGKKCKNYFIKSISNACPGVVEIDPVSVVKNGKKKKKYLKLETGDFVLFNVNTLYMGVKIPAGKHTVALEYHSPGIRIGVAVSSICWYIFILLIISR